MPTNPYNETLFPPAPLGYVTLEPRPEDWEKTLQKAVEERRYARINVPADMVYQTVFCGARVPLCKGLPDVCTVCGVSYVDANDYISLLLVSPSFEVINQGGVPTLTVEWH